LQAFDTQHGARDAFATRTTRQKRFEIAFGFDQDKMAVGTRDGVAQLLGVIE
jgi:hypothetical protein